MSLILRVDVDKPYGRGNVFQKTKSKIREDYWFPAIHRLGYLRCLEDFLGFCNSLSISGMFYFRSCTIPTKHVLKLIDSGNHILGFHAENTKTLSSFKLELNKFSDKLNGRSILTFTKHGSGKLKLGKNHYPPYEPEKYKQWSEELGIKYLFGNEICNSENDFVNKNCFLSKMFWINRAYRDSNLDSIEEIVEIAKYNNVPIIIHPSNFCINEVVRSDFEKLVRSAKYNNVPWTVL